MNEKCDIVISVEGAGHRDALTLMEELDEELQSKYPKESIHGLKPSEAMVFLVARSGDYAVGCGALRKISEGIAEVKRMFVRFDHRGRGISKQILRRLESTAIEFGHNRIWVETGDRQPESIGLFESSGYSRIPRYGEYANDPHSICFEKTL